MNPDGTNQRQLTVELAPVSSFDASRDGTELAYAAGGVVTVMEHRRIEREPVDTGRRPIRVRAGLRPGRPAPGPRPARCIRQRSRLLARADARGPPGDERQLLDHGAPPLGSGDAGRRRHRNRRRAELLDAPDLVRRRLGARRCSSRRRSRSFLVDTRDPGSQALAAPIQRRAHGRGIAGLGRGQERLRRGGHGGRRRPVRPLRGRPSGATSRIPNTDGATGPVTLGPTGRLAYLVRDTNGSGRAPPARPGRCRQRLPGTTGLADTWPAFSPDGARLVVVRARDPLPGSSGGIWVVDPIPRAPRSWPATGPSPAGSRRRWPPVGQVPCARAAGPVASGRRRSTCRRPGRPPAG